MFQAVPARPCGKNCYWMTKRYLNVEGLGLKVLGTFSPVNQTLLQKFMQPQDDNPYLHATDGKHLFIELTRDTHLMQQFIYIINNSTYFGL